MTLPADHPVARLLAEIACHVLSSDGRAHLIPAILNGTGRLEDDPITDGIAIFVGSELVTRVTPTAIRLGLQLQEGDDAAAKN